MPRRSNLEEPRHAGATRHGGQGAARRGLIPSFSMLSLLYAQVVKTLRRRRLVEVKPHVVFGTKAAVEQVLAACGWQINTAFVERLNLSLRQRVAALGRRSATPCNPTLTLHRYMIAVQTYKSTGCKTIVEKACM